MAFACVTLKWIIPESNVSEDGCGQGNRAEPVGAANAGLAGGQLGTPKLTCTGRIYIVVSSRSRRSSQVERTQMVRPIQAGLLQLEYGLLIT